MIDTAMILAAGRGERMRPLTDKMQKPLIPVGGMPMLEHTLARLKARRRNIVVNAHVFAEQIVDRLKGRAQVIVEDRLLDTGGSVKNALPLLGDGPFFVLNGDSLWRDGPQEPTLNRMEGRWGADRAGHALLLHPLHKVIRRETKDRGDYFIEPRGRLRHRGQAPLSPYVFASVSLCHPNLFRDSPMGLSLLQLWHRAEAEGRLRHDPRRRLVPYRHAQALATAERVLAERAGMSVFTIAIDRPLPTSWRWACWRNMAAIRWRWPTC